jgi:integrase
MGEFRRTWTAACKAAGVVPGRDGRVVYDIRRTAARNMLRAGVPDKVVMALMGWSDERMLHRYNIASDEDAREAQRRTSRYLKGLPASMNVVPRRKTQG